MAQSLNEPLLDATASAAGPEGEAQLKRATAGARWNVYVVYACNFFPSVAASRLSVAREVAAIVLREFARS